LKKEKRGGPLREEIVGTIMSPANIAEGERLGYKAKSEEGKGKTSRREKKKGTNEEGGKRPVSSRAHFMWDQDRPPSAWGKGKKCERRAQVKYKGENQSSSSQADAKTPLGAAQRGLYSEDEVKEKRR